MRYVKLINLALFTVLIMSSYVYANEHNERDLRKVDSEARAEGCGDPVCGK